MGDRNWYARKSKEDQTQVISKSVFVTNFPDHFSFRELWKVCDGYGKVIVDVFIPNKRSKSGKRFAFVRYIKINNIDRVVENLCTVWIGKIRLQANVVRYQRSPRSYENSFKPTVNVGHKMGSYGNKMGSYVSVLKTSNPHENSDSMKPALLLDDSCIVEKDLSLDLMGKVKDVGSLPNLYLILAKEGFENLSIRYLGGLWVIIEFQSITAKQKFSNHVGVGSWFGILNPASNSFIVDERVVWVDIEGIPINAWTQNTFSKIAAKWGELLDLEDSDDKSWYRKRLCIKMKLETIISESFKVIVKGKVYWVRAKEANVWFPEFNEEHNDTDSSDEESMGGRMGGVFGEKVNEQSIGEDSEVERVSESSFVNGHTYMHENMSTGTKMRTENEHSGDPFKIYDLLNKNQKKGDESIENNLPYPPGFTPLEEVCSMPQNNQNAGTTTNGSVTKESTEPLRDICQEVSEQMKKVRNNASVGSGRENTKGSRTRGGSILELMDELVKVGQTMGYNMDGFMKNMEDIIDSQGVDRGLVDLPLGGGSSMDILNERTKIVKDLQELDNIEALEVAQKAKVRWSIEGDWIEDPVKVKHEFVKHFAARFAIPSSDRIHLEMPFPRMLSENQIHELENHVTNEEIKRVVWACGVNKSPGPDGFTKKSKAMIFKVDFEKAYDSVRWDYLDDVLLKFGFGDRWRGWIQGCLKIDDGIHDAVFVGEWKDSNLRTIVHGLRCFYLASGLRLNIHKSKLMGIGVDKGEVVRAAKVLGVLHSKLLVYVSI
ncbi:RNA-directed DNA polymerase, eukaryota, nucleotide-binding alpha-beta plait domain protein [Tanacetum coccineum]